MIFILRWSSGLLGLLFLVMSIDTQIDGKASGNISPISGLPLSDLSVFAIGFLTSFFALRRPPNESRRNLGKWGNLLLVAVLAYDIVRLSLVSIGRIHKIETVMVVFVAVLLVVALGNMVACWRLPESGPTPSNSLDSDKRVSYLVRHWRGLLSLSHSYWLNGWLVTASTLAFQRILDSGSVTRSPQTAATLHALVLVIGMCFALWLVVGIWRSATRQMLTESQPVWGALAKLSLLLLLLNQVCPTLWVYLPMAREHWNEITGHDLVSPYQIQVSGNGEVIEFRGGIRLGSARAMQNVLTSFPKAKILKIESSGGRIADALRMTAMIRERNLATYAVRECASSATLMLCAGKERGAQEGTRIGFHTTRSFAGTSNISDASVMGSMMGAGISEEFVGRLMSVPPTSMWYPTAEEMLKAGVLTSYGVFPPLAATNATGLGPTPNPEHRETVPKTGN